MSLYDQWKTGSPYDEFEPKFTCTDCGEPCELVEETFDYAGTHCTNGKSGTHHTGVYVSKCCGADYEAE